MSLLGESASISCKTGLMQIPFSFQGQFLLQDVTQNGTWDEVQTRTITFAIVTVWRIIP